MTCVMRTSWKEGRMASKHIKCMYVHKIKFREKNQGINFYWELWIKLVVTIRVLKGKWIKVSADVL